MSFLAFAEGPSVSEAPFQHTWTERRVVLLGLGDRCAKQRDSVYLVPIHATFLGHGSHCTQFWRTHYRSDDPHYWYYTNIEDPNDRGYDALRRVYLLQITRVMPDLLD